MDTGFSMSEGDGSARIKRSLRTAMWLCGLATLADFTTTVAKDNAKYKVQIVCATAGVVTLLEYRGYLEGVLGCLGCLRFVSSLNNELTTNMLVGSFVFHLLFD